MYYDPRHKPIPLPHDPLTALVVPRPIGWISTLGRNGIVNLAPYSFFNAVAANPPFVMFSSAGIKHSQLNAEQTGEFVASLATYELREEL
ncbi:MAG: flavin reductase, partial [Deltaproteobacteria bacterium]|nr:flavin reductase [Deltaproteobacteria bacterium]